MNELIKKLAEQANLKLDELPDDTFIPLEKFTELIVQECASVADKYTIDGDWHIAEIIKQHFGVE